ncbi:MULTISPECIES: metallophosphoesterase [unclassified Mesobacillus]|uniref:metallophosphoesterase n=1 Tax=unclassified Mesobacillus TaxID=2675270 RepID=UPI00203E1CFE|nr:metallophosphoesterase [Mesobacillus sp. MER 33]MCM3235706.1 metallophosphoesterase [Mesobacillus sp. MER 48]
MIDLKIAILSDIHEGLNRKNTGTDIMTVLKRWIEAHLPDVFILSGDMTAGPKKTLDLLNQLQSDFPQTRVLFVHGNHDIYYEDSKTSYEILLEFPGNLGSGPIELNNDWVIIGDGGWYDYTFGVKGYTREQFALGKFNKFTWPDKLYANWPGQDQDETERYCEKLEGWLSAYSGKNIIMVTHFVPFPKFVIYKDDPSWDFFNAMMGSSRFGELAVKYGVKKYIFGHIHRRYHEQYKGMEIICNPLGYYPHEWDCESVEEEIFSRVKVIEI